MGASALVDRNGWRLAGAYGGQDEVGIRTGDSASCSAGCTVSAGGSAAHLAGAPSMAARPGVHQCIPSQPTSVIGFAQVAFRAEIVSRRAGLRPALGMRAEGASHAE